MKLAASRKAKQKAQCRSDWNLGRLSWRRRGLGDLTIHGLTPEKATRPPSPSASQHVLSSCGHLGKVQIPHEIVSKEDRKHYGVIGERSTLSASDVDVILSIFYNDYLKCVGGRFQYRDRPITNTASQQYLVSDDKGDVALSRGPRWNLPSHGRCVGFRVEPSDAGHALRRRSSNGRASSFSHEPRHRANTC